MLYVKCYQTISSILQLWLELIQQDTSTWNECKKNEPKLMHNNHQSSVSSVVKQGHLSHLWMFRDFMWSQLFSLDKCGKLNLWNKSILLNSTANYYKDEKYLDSYYVCL